MVAVTCLGLSLPCIHRALQLLFSALVQASKDGSIGKQLAQPAAGPCLSTLLLLSPLPLHPSFSPLVLPLAGAQPEVHAVQLQPVHVSARLKKGTVPLSDFF